MSGGDARALFTWACSGPRRPGLRVEAGRGGRFRLVQDERVVLDATVLHGPVGVDVERVAPFRSPLPPLRADAARGASPDPDGSRWAHRFVASLSGNPLGPLHDGVWLASAHTPLPEAEQLDGSADEIDWYRWPWHGGKVISPEELRVVPLLPLRNLSRPDQARVKSYRKQSREGVLPPVLAWWVSGLFALVVLDGHNRLVAARAEGTPPRVITFGPAADSGRFGPTRALA